jgi:hypothetical protein
MAKPASNRDLFWEFAQAEFDCERYGHLYRPRLSAALVSALEAGEKSGLTDNDWNQLASAVASVRTALTLGPLRLGTTWQYDTFRTDRLGAVRFVRMPDFEEVAPSRTIDELARGIREGKKFRERPGEEDFGAMAERRAREFEVSKLRGAIILLSTDGSPPYLLIEGLTRSTALTIRVQRREAVPSAVSVLIGTCPNLGSWYFY